MQWKHEKDGVPTEEYMWYKGAARCSSVKILAASTIMNGCEAPVRAYHVLMVTIDAEIPSNPRKDGYAQTREMHGLCDRPTDQESAREPMPFKPNHQLRPIQINALSKPRLVRSYLTGGKPSGENGSHAHGYIELMPEQGASRTY